MKTINIKAINNGIVMSMNRISMMMMMMMIKIKIRGINLIMNLMNKILMKFLDSLKRI
jgi:hypothetical protein